MISIPNLQYSYWMGSRILNLIRDNHSSFSMRMSAESRCGVQGTGCEIQGAGCEGCRVWGAGVSVQGLRDAVDYVRWRVQRV